MQIKLYINNTMLDATKDMVGAIDNSDFSVEHIVVVPDKFSLQMEKLILRTMKNKALFNVRVVGLTALAIDILDKLNVKCDILTSGESLLLTEQAIENVKDQLKTLSKSSISFCHEINKIISQLKSSLVSAEELNEKAAGITGAKYHDLSLIYNEYQRLHAGRFDANERLNLLSEMLKESDVLKNTKLYFAQFDSFTKEGYALIRNIVRASLEVSVSIAEPLSLGNDYIYEKDSFDKMLSISQELGAMLEVRKGQQKMQAQKLAIVRGLYSYEKVKCTNEGYYTLFSANNLTEEVEGVAKIIYNLVSRGLSYKDVAVMVSDVNKYQTLIENVFLKYDFPVYIDSVTTADKTILGNAILSLFDVVIHGYSSEKLLGIFNNILLGVNEELTARCQKYDVEGKGKFKKYVSSDFNYSWVFDEVEKATSTIEYSNLIRKLCSELKDSFNYLMQNLEEKTYIKEKNINIQMFDIVNETLDLIDKYKFDSLSLSDYIKKFKLLLSFKQVSTVPTFADGILVGDATTSSLLDSKVLIILGSQSLPIMASDNGLLSDDDIKLNFADKKIEPTIRMINRRNRFKLFNLLTLAKDKLILTYQVTNDEGKKTELPAFITSLNNIFDAISIKLSSFSLFNANSVSEVKLAIGCRKNFVDEYFSKIREEDSKRYQLEKELPFIDLKIEKNKILVNAKELYFYKERIRVTQLEQYFVCPFKHFACYGLELKEKEDTQFDVKDFGNICHRGAELFVKEYMKRDKVHVETFVEQNFMKIIKDELLEEKLDANNEKASLLRYIKNQLRVLLYDILRELDCSAFKPKYIEMKFDNMTLGDKNKIKMIGKADRIDVCDDYFRILDYKTGKTGNLLKELYYGNKLQLFLYQKTAKALLNKRPAGVFYFNAKYDYAKNDEDKVVLKGLVENDDNIIEKIDTTIEQKSKSRIASISLSADEKKGRYKGSAIAKERLSVYEEYAQRVADKAVDEIAEGYIEPKPNEEGCKYCKYFSICQFENLQGKRTSEKIGDFK